MDTKDKRNFFDDYTKVVKKVFIVVAFIVLTFFMVGELILPNERDVVSIECSVFETDWYHVLEDGERKKVEIPGKLPAEYGELVTIETQLPQDIFNRECLCFRIVWQDAEVYIDGELRESYTTKDSRPFGTNSAFRYLFVELYEEDAGKTLSFQFSSNSKYAGDVRTVYIGDRASIWLHFFNEFGSKTMVAVLLFVVSLLCIIVCTILQYVYRRKLSLKYLAWALFFCAFWMISEMEFRQLIFKNVSVLTNCTYMCLMLIPIPLTTYIDDVQAGRYRKIYKFPMIYSAIIMVVGAVLQVFDIVQFVEQLPFIHAGIAITMICIIGTIVWDAFTKKISGYFFVGVGLCGMLVSAIFELVLYYINPRYTLGAILSGGLLFLLVMAVVKTGQDWFESEKKKQQAILSSKAQAQFLANMSHEIRTPINAVIGMNEMILRENENEMIREYAHNIQSSSNMLLSLVNDVLDFSKIESGRLELVEGTYHLGSLLQDAMLLLNARATNKAISTQMEIDSNMPSKLYGDELRIKQILTNLLSNAVKYTKEGSVTLKAKCSLVDEENIVLNISVVDTGIGIKKDDLGKLFDSFKRLELSKNRNIEGTGLGLNIAKSLVELMNGYITVESEYGKGSTFIVSIPQRIIDSKPIGNLEESVRQYRNEQLKPGQRFIAPDARILVVDDNIMNLSVIKALLKRTQIQTEIAESGMKCLELTKKNKYDIILMDHMMPEMDGIETLHKLRADDENSNHNSVVIALTANAIAGCREMYMEKGFDDYCSKPVKADMLDALLLHHLPKDIVQLVDK